MEIYQCRQSNYIAQLKAILLRLPQHHERWNEIQIQLKRELSGIKGQNALEFPLQFLPFEHPPNIIHNIRLKDEHQFFEIDTLLISRHFVLVLEVKNWYGTLYADDERQLIRVGDDGLEEGMPNPFSQVKLQSYRFKKWLANNNLPSHMPMLHLVVIAYSSTIVKSQNHDLPLSPYLIHSNQLPLKIDEFIRDYPDQCLNQSMINRMTEVITSAHQVKRTNPIERFNLKKADFIQGVFCQKCSMASMLRTYGNWTCLHCGMRSANAHLQALKDYQLIFGNEISKRETSEFLKVESLYTVQRLLKNAGLRAAGNTRRRVFNLEGLPE